MALQNTQQPTRIYKDFRNQWNAKTNINFDKFNDEGKQMVLSITSSKGGKGLQAYATVSWHDESSSTHAVFQDFSRKIHTEVYKRITEKAITEFHEYVLDTLKDAAIKDVEEHYENTSS